MRKITYESAAALRNHNHLKKGNMEVSEGSCYLHGNKIASLSKNILSLTDCGWQTSTTKERLNGILSTFLLPFSLYQENFVWYLYNYETEKTVKWEGYKTFKI